MTRLEISGDYTADWPAISRATKDEAGWRCVRCLHPFDADSGKPLACDDGCDSRRGRKQPATDIHDWAGTVSAHRWSEYGLNYGVHHLDGDKSNNAWWNRLALCNSCHLSVQATVIPARLWMLNHSEWFRIYAAGYYAHQAGATTTREEVAAAVDRWLAQGQPWLLPAPRAEVALTATATTYGT